MRSVGGPGWYWQRNIDLEVEMAIGPVQLLVLGFNQPTITGAIIEEFNRLRDNDMVRVIDSLTVYKDADGEVAVLKASQLSDEEAMEFGAKVGALVGLGAGGEEGAIAGAVLGAEAAAEGVEIFDEDEVWDVLDELPSDSAAALILIDHRWAIPLRDAVYAAGGFPVSSGFISPLDLVAIGLITAAEVEALAPAER
jgi:uncharacterized membrane protein